MALAPPSSSLAALLHRPHGEDDDLHRPETPARVAAAAAARRRRARRRLRRRLGPPHAHVLAGWVILCAFHYNTARIYYYGHVTNV